MMFVVFTQYMENYGAHAEDGKFSSGNSYWKFKGGETYFVSDVDRVQDAVAFVAAKCMENTVGCKEFPATWMSHGEWIQGKEADDIRWHEDQGKWVTPNDPFGPTKRPQR